MNAGGWLGQYRSNVEAEPSAGDAGDREKSEIMFLFRLPASTHPRPPPPANTYYNDCFLPDSYL